MVRFLHMHTKWVRFLLALAVLVSISFSAHAAELDEYSVFISGFTAFQNQDYQGAATKMSQFLKEYPSTPLRDMALFWLARAHYRLGNKQEAARYMAQFLKENPDTPLRTAVEDDLITLADAYGKGETAVAGAHQVPDDANANTRVSQVPAPPAVTTAVEFRPAPRSAEGRPRAAQVITGKDDKAAVTQAPAMAMKERAVEEYRSVMEKYPGTRAASVAAERLKGLGEQVPAAGMPRQQAAVPSAEGTTSRVITLEVGQYAAADLSVLSYATSCAAGTRISVPFEVVNRGNGTDSFILENGFPAEFRARIVAAAHPEATLSETPLLKPGERFAGALVLAAPATVVDGQRSTYPIRLVSKLDRDISLTREIPLSFTAPLLRMVVKPEKETVLPGETVTYRMALLNIGSAAAKKISFLLSYPPQYEPVEPLPGGFRRESRSQLAFEEMEIGSGGRKEFSIAFRLKEEALAGQELFCRAELRNRELQLAETFLSPAALVGRISGVTVRVASFTRKVIPGERIVVPISVINTGNARDSFTLNANIPASYRYAVYRSSGTGTVAADEAVGNSIGTLSPHEERELKLEVYAPTAEVDGSEAALTMSFEPDSDRSKSAVVSVAVIVSRPVVVLETEAARGRLKPGDVAHLVLNVVNNGSNTAKEVDVVSLLPESLEVVASEPRASDVAKGTWAWRFSELGPGEKRTIVLAYRVRSTVAAGTSLRIENLVRYKDQLGNAY